MENENQNMIPNQHTGSQMDAVEERKLNSLFSAQQFFEAASKRLLSVNDWGQYSPGTTFKLHDAEANPVERTAQIGDYIQIDIPGPGSKSGGGYDWVHIEDIQHLDDGDTQFTGMLVRPCRNPLENGTDIAHFLKDEATSTFIIRRDRIRVWAEEHGRNEVANIDAEHIIDKARNLVVGISAKFGLSYPQWKMLVQGLLDGRM